MGSISLSCWIEVFQSQKNLETSSCSGGTVSKLVSKLFKWVEPSDTYQGLACLPYISGVTEPLTRLLRNNEIRVARVRFPDPVSQVGWGWFLSLLRGFFSGFSGFPPSTKINISKFQFDREFEGHGFVSHMTVMCNPRKTKLIWFLILIRVASKPKFIQPSDLQCNLMLFTKSK